MAFAALRCAAGSPATRPNVRRRLAAAACAAAAASWAPQALAVSVERVIDAEAGVEPDSRPEAKPPSFRKAVHVDDGLDEVRWRIRQYGLRSVEEKLISLLREFKADERQSLNLFAEAEAKGDDKRMRIWHSEWKSTTEKIELLQSNPRKFVDEHGYLYGITA